ncbi:MAG: N-acetyltransferase family protein [Bdellovibrionota bacterium]
MGFVASREFICKNGEKVLIRTGVESDAEPLLETLRAYLEDGEGMVIGVDEFPFFTQVEKEREWIRSHQLGATSLLLIAFHGELVIGNINFQTATRKRLAHAGEFGIALHPAWRSQGVGSALLDGLVHWARGNPGVERLNLKVLKSNHRGIALYRKFGFQQEGLMPRSVKYPDGSYGDDVLMGLDVSQS